MSGGPLSPVSNIASGLSTPPSVGVAGGLPSAPTVGGAMPSLPGFGGITDMIGQNLQNRLDQSPFVQALNSVTGMDLARPFTPSVPGQQPQPMEVASLSGGQAPRVPESTSDPNTTDYEPMIRKIAREEGVSPDVAVRVANTEGGTKGWIRSAVPRPGGKTEPSFGPLQMLVGGGDTGLPEGLGNDFIRQTGLDPADPKNAEPALRFAIKHAAKNGWGAWYGAAKGGIGEFEGIRQGRGGGTTQPTPSSLLTSSDPMLKGSQPALVDRFQALQEAWGSPLALNSAFRDTAKNKAVGGAKGSQHLGGNALDINVRDMPIAERIALIRQASDLGFTGIGVYNNALHLDLGARRNWGPSYGKESTPSWAKDVIAYHMGNTAADAKRPGAQRPTTYDMAGNPVPQMGGQFPPRPKLGAMDRVKNALAGLDLTKRSGRGAPQIDVSAGMSAAQSPAVDLGAQEVAQSQANINARRGPSQRSMARKQALQQRLRYQA